MLSWARGPHRIDGHEPCFSLSFEVQALTWLSLSADIPGQGCDAARRDRTGWAGTTATDQSDENLLLFLVVLSFIEPWDSGDERWVPWAVVAYGVALLAWVATMRRRPLPMVSQLSPESLAASYRTTFFLELALAEAAAIGGVVGAFVGGSLFPFVSVSKDTSTRRS